MTTLYLVRHGEVHNPTGIIYGRLPGFGLSENGRVQLGHAADLLAAGRFWIPGAAREVCESGIQVLGGMGFTWEMGLHLWYRRTLHIQAVLGGSHGAAAAAGTHFVGRARAAAGVEGEQRSD